MPSTNNSKSILLWAALVWICLLAGFSIYGAFIGTDRAKQFFNTIPLSIYWFAFVLLLVVSFWSFGRLIKHPALLLIHAGCLLVLIGAMYGSVASHHLQSTLLGIDKIRTGRMIIYENDQTDIVFLPDGAEKQLPFSIRLKDFRIEHYEPGYLLTSADDKANRRLPANTDAEYDLGPQYGKVTILRRFRNFKLTIENDKRIAVDAPGGDENPALELRLTGPDGATKTRYVFERFPGHAHPDEKLSFSYYRPIREYISELQVIKDSTVASEKDIEVNHPLRFAGQIFYQHSYDDQASQYTVLQVVSDSGLSVVYLGYTLLCIGVFWQMWFVKLKKARR